LKIFSIKYTPVCVSDHMNNCLVCSLYLRKIIKILKENILI